MKFLGTGTETNHYTSVTVQLGAGRCSSFSVYRFTAYRACETYQAALMAAVVSDGDELEAAGMDVEEEPSLGPVLTTTAYQALVLQGMQDLRTEGLLCDYTLIADDCRFRVHKTLLASVCDYFRAVFRSGMLEVHKDFMELKGVSAAGLHGVLDFIYTGELSLNRENALDVFSTANHLQIEPVIKACTRFLISSLNMENIKDMQSIADVYNVEELKKAIHDFLIVKFNKFSKTNYFKQLPLSEVCKLIKDNDLRCTSEFKLMKIVLEWIKYSQENREPLIGNIMKYIRLAFMASEELHYLLKMPFIQKNRHCVSLIEEAMYFRDHPNEQIMLVSPSTEVRSVEYVIAFGCAKQQTLRSCILYAGDWCQLDRAMGQPRPFTNAAAQVYNNFLFVCGGQAIREPTSSCLRFNPITCKWTTICPMSKPRRNFALVSHDLHLYAIGGICKNHEVTNSVEMYSIEHNSWTEVSPMTAYLADLSACAYNRKIYVAGGVDENCLHVNDFRIYNINSDSWKSGPNISEIKFKPVIFAKDNVLYVLDLYRTEGAPAHLELYDMCMQQWTNITLMGVHFSRGFSAVMIEDWIYFVGRNDVEDGGSKRYNILTGIIDNIRAYPWEIETPLCVSLKLPYKFLKKAIMRENDWNYM